MRKCSKCFGRGKTFKPDGFTKADLVDCTTCMGTGELPDRTTNVRHKSRNLKYNKDEGMDLLKLVEPV